MALRAGCQTTSSRRNLECTRFRATRHRPGRSTRQTFRKVECDVARLLVRLRKLACTFPTCLVAALATPVRSRVHSLRALHPALAHALYVTRTKHTSHVRISPQMLPDQSRALVRAVFSVRTWTHRVDSLALVRTPRNGGLVEDVVRLRPIGKLLCWYAPKQSYEQNNRQPHAALAYFGDISSTHADTVRIGSWICALSIQT